MMLTLKHELFIYGIKISEIAREAGVHKATASNAINGRYNSKKVIVAAERLLETKKKEKGLDI